MAPQHKNPLAGFHARMMGVYYEAWFADEPGTQGPERDKDAFHLLEHAGMLYRLTKNPEVTLMLDDEPEEVRYELVEAAMRAMDTESWAGLLSDVDDSRESQTMLEEAVLFRDILGVVWDLANELTLDAVPEETPGLHAAMQQAHDRMRALDRQFGVVDKLALMHALHVLDGVRDCIAEDEAEECWWLRDPEPLIANYLKAHEGPILDMLESARRASWQLFWERLKNNQAALPVLAAAADSGKDIPPMELLGLSEAHVLGTADSKGLLHLRLDEDGRAPEWVEGARLAASDADGGEIGSAELDKHGRCSIPAEHVEALAMGGRIDILNAQGKKIGEIIPKLDKD